MDPSAARQLRRVRTLGRGASGAVVWLASDDASGQLLAVKSAAAAGGAAAQLRREEQVLEGLCSPHVVACLGSRAAAGGEHHLFLEFAPGGSLADEAARSGGRLEEPAIRAYARDMARGLAYLHGRSLVHGDVKTRNVVIGGDGRARLTDFGCARPVQPSPSPSRPIGGTPAFMAPEVARGEEQGPPADVWAVACTVVEMATGRAPWSDEDDVFAAVHRIGYTDAVPELPAWLSAQAKDFLRMCLARQPRSRPTAVQLLEHPFLASACCDAKPAKHDWPSPNSTLNAAFWESDEDEEEEASERAVERISSLASPWSGFSDWDSDEGWTEVLSECSKVSEAPAATVTTGAGFALRNEALDAAVVDLHDVVVVEEGAIRFPTCNVEARDDSSKCQRHSRVSAGGNVGNFCEFSRCQSHSRVSVGSNVGVADGLVKCQIHPRMSVGSNVGIADDVVKWQRHLRVSVGSNVEYLRPVASNRGETVELDCPCNVEVEHKFNLVPIRPFC
ncbi:mitogen-activated protein kinase kinase kinase 17-like [Panicum virgatum]|uniref:mitogen-activated protein kinase kinase kinase 17-like n=1 Tax=Panicum virgatum TaxID=38727 RepID=UPI0019D58EEF|nr:mitogen-activated protein kinase kinase kinase 17-like [Panicum virgatum]